jgi:hypothetical protein
MISFLIGLNSKNKRCILYEDKISKFLLNTSKKVTKKLILILFNTFVSESDISLIDIK